MSNTSKELLRYRLPLMTEAEIPPSDGGDPVACRWYYEAEAVNARIAALEQALRQASLCDSCGCRCHKVCTNQNCEAL
jgi:hypothetical protein